MPNGLLSYGSLMQLVQFYSYRLSEQKSVEGNKWQEYVYPNIASIFDDLHKMLCEIVADLNNEDDINMDVVKINIYGYDGKLPKKVNVQYVDEKKRYSNADVSEVLRHIVQRVDYIINAEVPKRYLNDNYMIHSFKRVQEKIRGYKNKVQEAQTLWKIIRKTATRLK